MKKLFRGLGGIVVFAGCVALFLFLLDTFVPRSSPIRAFLASPPQAGVSVAEAAAVHEEPHALALSDQALRNIGITGQSIGKVALSSYDKTISFPAILTGRPGRSTFLVPAPFTGTVQKVFVEPGMVVDPGQPLFEIALTHEELIRCQTDLITLCQKRDTLLREQQRLASLGSDLAPQAKREVDIQKTELDAQIETQRGILRIHGISEKEIQETIEEKRSLVRTIAVRVPEVMDSGHKEPVADQTRTIIQMEELLVEKGQLVEMGASLCQLVDLSLLYIEGRAGAVDEAILATALMEHCRVTAFFDGERVDNLQIRYIDTRVDPLSRALRFYVELPNEVVVQDAEHSHHHPWREGESMDGCETHRHYVNWRFRPGQRCELKVEYDTIPDCIVLPREALAEAGGETFVFEWTGSEPDGNKRKIWTKRPVHVLHRGKSQVAVAHDGSLLPGSRIASRGAGQLLVALGSGGGSLQSTCPCPDH